MPMPLTELQAINDDLPAGVGADLRLLVARDGALAEASSVSVTVVGAESGTVTTGAVASIGTGQYVAPVAGSELAEPDRLTATWTVTFGSESHEHVAVYDVVEDVLFNVEQVRTLDTGRIDSTKLTDKTVLVLRRVVRDIFEQHLNYGLGGRYERRVLSGDGGDTLYFPRYHVRGLRSLTVDGSPVDVSDPNEVDYEEHGAVWRASGFPAGRRNVVVGYVHGLAPIPGDLKRAALETLKEAFVPSEGHRRAMIVTDETGTYRLNQPDARDRPTGIPQVDGILNRMRMPTIS